MSWHHHSTAATSTSTFHTRCRVLIFNGRRSERHQRAHRQLRVPTLTWRTERPPSHDNRDIAIRLPNTWPSRQRSSSSKALRGRRRICHSRIIAPMAITSSRAISMMRFRHYQSCFGVLPARFLIYTGEALISTTVPPQAMTLPQ